ncbi:Gamma-aminobutyric acid (GABA) B receptor [Seminavis robusta]|uniref:Gamma-aminobutyric acid (GABA) B receptor n=1 Tax=Seminavis robusta TaxID=568900 RepID=A0A9N8EG33_9STRA|nr:Gamma-aminobutyric acid (GABA) B receptor [Seminavis robusta]|eukprot:Sro885_g216040.1 Gamma-aminobutyric acid (GABA) B receptor (819) ;mRNA; r:8047-10503
MSSSSAIRYIDSNGRQYRQGHLMSLLPTTTVSEGERFLEETRVFNDLSAFLAYKHSQNRSSQVLPDLSQRLASCDFQWTFLASDTQFSPIETVRGLTTYLDRVRASKTANATNSTLTNTEDLPVLSANTTNISPSQGTELPLQQPFALLGAAKSISSHSLSVLAGMMELPQISSSSTSDVLDDAPFFARTIYPTSGTSKALMVYLKSLGVTHVGLLFINDTWGRSYQKNLAFSAKQFGIYLHPFAYNELDDFDERVQELKNSQMQYFIGALKPGYWKTAVRKLYSHGLMGKKTEDSIHYQWFFGGLLDLVAEGFVLNAKEDWDLAHALHGAGVVVQKVTPNDAFNKALASIKDDKAFQQDFINSHSEPHLFDNFTFDYPGWSKIQYLTYDAVIALGITACQTPGLFTGTEFYHNLLKIDFEGVSGRVQLDSKTGNRREDGVEFEIINVVISDRTSAREGGNESISFTRNATALITFHPETHQGNVELLQPFFYNDNTTKPPPVLPRLEENMNLIPEPVLIFGFCLAGIIILQSIGWAGWVYVNRKQPVASAAQPLFLTLLCMGTFLMALAIIPLGLQEPNTGLDAACMSIPWLVCIGFCVAMSALLSKAIRINKLMKSGTAFRRVALKPTDVMRPFLTLMCINVAFLLAWTASPYSLSWQRTKVNNYDEFRRQVESVGMCRPQGGHWYLFFFLPLAAVNIVATGLATYHTYKARDLPVEFGETRYLALSMITLSEICLIGLPTIGVVVGSPTGLYLVVSIVLFVSCNAILLPLFVPKYLCRNVLARGNSFCNSISAYNMDQSKNRRALPFRDQATHFA